MTTIRILIVVALQTLALAYMIFDRQAMLDSARVVTLKVVPVDPRDIFRGDYVVLSYDVSRLDLHKLDGDDNINSGDIVFVTFQKEAADWKPVALKLNQPLAVQGGIAIRATVQYAETSTALDQPAMASLTYGVESYFVPEGTGKAIEEDARSGKLTVDIAVDPKGRAAIKALRRNGQVYYVEGIF